MQGRRLSVPRHYSSKTFPNTSTTFGQFPDNSFFLYLLIKQGHESVNGVYRWAGQTGS